MKNLLLILFVLNVSTSFGQERVAERVSYYNDKTLLTAWLIKPGKGEYPAVVFQQGSGGYSFDGYDKAAWGPHGYYIEDVLLKAGYAIMYCNKRGLGGSKGNWKRNDFYGRADDAYAAVEYLRTRTDIEGSNIGISGHSQGGWVAQIAAAEHSDISFVIALAGPTRGVMDETLSFDRHMYQCDGRSGEDLDNRIDRRRKGRQFNAKIGKALPFYGTAWHWSLIANYEHDQVLRDNQQPTLLLFAEYDTNVDAHENIDYLNKVFNNEVPDNYQVEVMTGGQHGFYQVDNRCVGWDEAMESSFDPEFQTIITHWVKQLK
ncbi:MAG: prolyl oligopeptidase family serine peptidase [Cyclobacteriaceae bacterium]